MRPAVLHCRPIVCTKFVWKTKFGTQRKGTTMKKDVFEMTRTILWRGFWAFALMLISLSAVAPSAQSQTTVGGHIGFVLPLVTHAGGETTTLGDNFSIG